MNWSLVDPGVIRPWLICETGSRWLSAVRRFGPDMLPADLIPKVESATRDEILSGLSLSEPSIVLWEVGRDSLAAVCDSLAQSTAATRDEWFSMSRTTTHGKGTVETR